MRMGRTGIGATPSSRRFRIFLGFLRPFRNKKTRQKIEGTVLNFRTMPRSPDRRDLRVHEDWRFGSRRRLHRSTVGSGPKAPTLLPFPPSAHVNNTTAGYLDCRTPFLIAITHLSPGGGFSPPPPLFS